MAELKNVPQQPPQQQKMVIPDRTEPPEEILMMAKALEEMQLTLEPVRDSALDRKAFYTGYAQCAEEMIKVIVSKMTYLKNQAEKRKKYLETMEKEAQEGEERLENIKMEEAKKSNGKTRGKIKKEENSPE